MINTKGDTSEHWRVLSSHRFERAIASFLNFPARPSSEWLALMQASLSLTYEGKSVRHTVLFWRQKTSTKRFKRYYVPFSQALSLEKALMSEKWVRAVIDGRRAALVGDETGDITGMLSLDALAYEESIDAESLPTFAPHASLLPLQYALRAADISLITSPAGDLYVLTGGEVLFYKTQGQWHYIGLSQIQSVLSRHLSESLAIALMRTALDLSYERRGALLCVLETDQDVVQMIGDHSNPEANRSLREALRGRDLLRWAERQIITAAASTDGATVLSMNGKVLDVACLISPTEERWLKFGVVQPRVFSGARTTAAWKASWFGIVAKISDDGPVEILLRGDPIGAFSGAIY